MNDTNIGKNGKPTTDLGYNLPTTNLKNILFHNCETEKRKREMMELHKDAITFCREHNLTFNLASSDINIFVENCPDNLKSKIEATFRDFYKDATLFWNADELEIS